MDIIEESKLISSDYECKVKKLLQELSSSSSLSDIREVFINFSKKYTMIPQLWNKWLKLEENFLSENFNQVAFANRKKEIKADARRHFFLYEFVDDDKVVLHDEGDFDDFMLSSNVLYKAFRYSLMCPSNVEVLENSFQYPHGSLKEAKRICKKFTTHPIPSKTLKRYRESVQIFEIFKSQVNDWQKQLIQNPDKFFVIKSFECYLGMYPSHQKVWKFYIGFLQNLNLKLMLNTYSRYCRLHTNDMQMRREYQEWVEKKICGSMAEHLWWFIDVIEIERIFGDSVKKLIDKLHKSFSKNAAFLEYLEWFQNLEENDSDSFFLFKLPEMAFPSPLPKKPFKILNSHLPSPLYFLPKNSHHQQFCFPFYVMNYLKMKCNFTVKQKLYQSCKSFYQSYSQKPLCHRLGAFPNSTTSTYFNQSIFLNSNTFQNFAGFNGIILTNLLQIDLPQNPAATSRILSKIYECKILYCQLHGQNLTEKEFDKLVGHRTKELSLQKVVIQNEKKIIITAVEILAKIPNAYSISIVPIFPSLSEAMYTFDTAEKITKLERKKNITNFALSSLRADFNECFFHFIKKYALCDAYVYLAFISDVGDQFKEAFTKKGEDIIGCQTMDIYVA